MSDPAKPRAQLWRTALGFVLIGIVYMALIMITIAIATVALGPETLLGLERGISPASMLALLGTFSFMSAGVWVVTRLLHKRGITTLLGPVALALADFKRTMIVLIALNIVLWALSTLGTEPIGTITRQHDLPLWIMLLIPALILIFVQISAEELLFRGYLQSQLAARFSSPLIWMVIPSVLFGLLHHDPVQMGGNAIYVTGWAIMFGLFTADLTARAGNLGPALAMHFTNNVAALLFVGLPGSLSGLSLYLLDVSPSDPALLPWLWLDLATMVVSWLAVRWAIRR